MISLCRCDKVIPCSNCIKRGKSDECHLEEVIKDNASFVPFRRPFTRPAY